MKKIFLILMIFSFATNVLAEEIYSEYSNYTEYNEQEIIENELTDVQTETRYLWYKNTETKEDYILYNEEDKFTNDCYNTEFSEWSINIPPQNSNIETREANEYILANEVRYIRIDNVTTSSGTFKVSEIDVLLDNTIMDYQITCTNCTNDFHNNVTDNIIENYNVEVTNGGSIVIDLHKAYPVHKIKLDMYLHVLSENTLSYVISYQNESGTTYGISQLNHDKQRFQDSTIIKESHDIKVLPLNRWTYNYTTQNNYDENYIINQNNITQYRYNQKFCRPLNIINETNNIYSKEPINEYTIKGEEKIFYSYRTRQKLELKDLIITNKDYNLDNYIISTEDYTVTHNIEINKNGTYQINIKSESFDITRDVEVNIIENTVNEYQAIIDKLNDDINKLNEEIKDLTKSYELNLSDLNNKISELEKELNNCKIECQTIKNNLEQLKEEYDKLSKEYEEKLLEYSNKINENLTIIEQYKNDLSNKDLENNNLKNEIDSLLNYIADLENSSKKTNDEIISYYENKINIIDKTYQDKIIELETQLKNQNEEISKVTKLNDDLINSLNNQIEDLNKQRTNEYNDYLLKVDNLENINWIIILILVMLFLITLIVQKMSRRKKH